MYKYHTQLDIVHKRWWKPLQTYLLGHVCCAPETHGEEEPDGEAQTQEGLRHCPGADYPARCAGV